MKEIKKMQLLRVNLVKWLQRMGADEIEYSSINLDNSVLSRKHIKHTVLISLITLHLHRSKIKTKNA